MSTHDPAPPSLPKDPKLLIRDVLLDRWDPTATYGYDPTVAPHKDSGLSLNRGWWDENDFSVHVAITAGGGGNNTNNIGLSGSGYDFLTADGPGQDRRPRFLLTAFAEAHPDEQQRYGASAEDLAWDLGSHAESALLAANASEAPDALPSPLVSIATDALGSIPDTDGTPVTHTRQIEVLLAWPRMPAADA